MNEHQKLLIDLLNHAIRGTVPAKNDIVALDLAELYKEASAHAVDELLYPAIKALHQQNPEIFNASANTTFIVWERTTLGSCLTQFQHVHKLGQILTLLEQAGIPVIALKGLVLREFYPTPELRNMGDADLLIRAEDMERASLLLVESGYLLDIAGVKHTTFVHSDHLPIELHHSLIDNTKLKGAKEYQRKIWDNAVRSNVCGTNALVLSPTDQLIHLLFHMAQHMISSGFGLRQLCDVVVFIEKQQALIEWNTFYMSIERYGISPFAMAIFSVCRLLFCLEVVPPACDTTHLEHAHSKSHTYLEEATRNGNDYISILINDILSGGTFGRKSTERTVVGLQLHFSSKTSITPLAKLSHYATLLLPPAKKLGDRYKYAQVHTILLPIAWIHRIIFCILRKDVSLKSKTTYLVPKNTTLEAFEKRAQLLKWLGLR